MVGCDMADQVRLLVVLPARDRTIERGWRHGSWKAKSPALTKSSPASRRGSPCRRRKFRPTASTCPVSTSPRQWRGSALPESALRTHARITQDVGPDRRLSRSVSGSAWTVVLCGTERFAGLPAAHRGPSGRPKQTPPAVAQREAIDMGETRYKAQAACFPAGSCIRAMPRQAPWHGPLVGRYPGWRRGPRVSFPDARGSQWTADTDRRPEPSCAYRCGGSSGWDLARAGSDPS